MKKGNITSFRLNPKKPPKTDWRAFDAMGEEPRSPIEVAKTLLSAHSWDTLKQSWLEHCQSTD